MEIYSVSDERFARYGKVIKSFDLTALLEQMQNTAEPDDVLYVPSEPKLEALPIFESLQERIYGEMPIQMGYCNGSNHKLNALEYHKDSEINIACTDVILLLGFLWDVQNGRYDTKNIEAFRVPAKTMVELYATTLHYAPCNANGKFRCVVVLPRGTNLPLEKHKEGSLLFAKNKWLIAHEEAAIRGAHIGLLGENISLGPDILGQ